MAPTRPAVELAAAAQRLRAELALNAAATVEVLGVTVDGAAAGEGAPVAAPSDLVRHVGAGATLPAPAPGADPEAVPIVIAASGARGAATVSSDAPLAVDTSGPVISPLQGPPARIADRYRVVGFVGGGGFGAVYKAIDERLEKVVAVKLLTGHRSSSDAAIRRFRAEALAASRLSHPCIVAVTDFDVLPDGRPYLVMEFVSAPTLELLLAGKPYLDAETAARVARQVCGGLQVAHAERVIHRDLKPANITVAYGEPDPVVKILDFGVAKLVQRPGVEGLTGAGQLLGTPAYMAPEQIRESLGPLDGRADLYSLGAVLYEMTTGRTPFAGRPVADVLLSHLGDEPSPPSRHRSGMPPALEAVILKALRKRPEDRFADAAAMGRALDRCLAAPSETPTSLVALPPPRRHLSPGLGLAVLLAVAAGAAGAWLLGRSRAPRPAGVARTAVAPAAVPAPGRAASRSAAARPAGVAGAPAPPAPAAPPRPTAPPATAPAPGKAAPPPPVATAAAPARAGPRPPSRGGRHGRRGRHAEGVLPDAPATKLRLPR